jgi:hypothetical protein
VVRKSTLSLSVALIASVSASAWLWHALETERTRNAELASQLERQQVVNPLVEASASPAVPMLAPAQIASPDSKQQTVKAADDPSREVNGLELIERERQLMLDPRYREAKRAQIRTGLKWRRSALIRLLGFTPVQADVAIDLEIDERLRWDDTVTASGDSVEDFKQAQARYEVFKREQHDKLRAAVGESKATKYRDYIDSWPSRRQVENFRSELGEVNALREDQVEPLIAALHVERTRMESEMTEFRESLDLNGDTERNAQLQGDRLTEQMKSMNARVIDTASSLLTNAQLAVLKDQLQQSLAQVEASKQLGMIQSKLDEARERGSPTN